jgi:hypothetical protein
MRSGGIASRPNSIAAGKACHIIGEVPYYWLLSDPFPRFEGGLAMGERIYVGKCPDHGITQVNAPREPKCLQCGKEAKGKGDLSKAEVKEAEALAAKIKGEGAEAPASPAAAAKPSAVSIVKAAPVNGPGLGDLVGQVEALVKTFGAEKVVEAVKFVGGNK